MGTVLACDFEVDSVLAGFDQFAVIVLTVPLERILAWPARCTGNGSHDFPAFGHGANAIGAIPCFHFREIPILVIPERNGLHLKSIGILHPRGHEGPLS